MMAGGKARLLDRRASEALFQAITFRMFRENTTYYDISDGSTVFYDISPAVSTVDIRHDDLL